MSDMEEFERKVREIFHLITEYGIISTEKDCGIEDIEQINNPEIREKFLIKCHEGWKLGQDRIVDELIQNAKNKIGIQETLKKNEDKKLISQYHRSLDILNFQELVLRKLSDSIAWQMFGANEHIVRRFAISEEYQQIQPENLLREKKRADSYNNANPTSFALLCDITSFIQIGDMIIIDVTEEKNIIKIFEIKDGQLNQIMRCILDHHPNISNNENFLDRIK